MSQMAMALIILAITIVLFITEPVPIVVTAIGASIAYAYTGIIEVKDIFSGYNSTTIVLLAGMMVVGSSLFHTGITDIIGEKMVKVTGKSERNIILATLIVSCALSSICSNIGVMTAMAPLVTAMCISAGVGPSKALLGLLFGAGRRRLQRLRGKRHGGTGPDPLRLLRHHPLRSRRQHPRHPVLHLHRLPPDSGHRICPGIREG